MVAPTQMLSGLLLLPLFLSLCCCTDKKRCVTNHLTDVMRTIILQTPTKQDKPNPALWLTTQAGKMANTGLPDRVPQEIVLINRLLPKLVQSRCMGYWQSVRSRWLDIGQVSCFLRVYGPRRSRGHKHEKKNEANIQPSWRNKLGP